jgi:glucose/arabinose dehydrogenase
MTIINSKVTTHAKVDFMNLIQESGYEQDGPRSNFFSGSLSIISKLILALFLIAVVVIGATAALHAIQVRHTQIPTTISTTTAATSTTTTQTFALTTTNITFSSGKTISLNIPQDYSINVAADGFRSARFMAWSPDHRLFLGEMTNASDTHTGRVIILDNFNMQNRTFSGAHTYLADLRNPNSVAFYQDPTGKQWIYIALTDELMRYPYTNGDNAPSATPQVIATFPDFGPSASGGGWHLTRTLAFDGDHLYVSVGSGCN